MKNIISYSLEDTKNIAKDFIAKINLRKDCIGFCGDLGSGKTTFIKYFFEFLGGDSSIVVSPTFTILNCYQLNRGLNIYHFDWYRIKDSKELLEIALDDFLVLDNSLILIEWYNEKLFFIDNIKIVSIKIIDENKREFSFLNV